MRSSRTALVLVATLAALLVAPAAHAGFYCRTVRSIPLEPVDPTAIVLRRGFAEIDECFGLSFLRVRVFGAVPGGTSFAVTLPGLEPILGDFFSLTRGRGDSLLEGLTNPGLAGREVDVVDEGFSPVLSGQF
jgi:hypothetical protein